MANRLAKEAFKVLLWSLIGVVVICVIGPLYLLCHRLNNYYFFKYCEKSDDILQGWEKYSKATHIYRPITDWTDNTLDAYRTKLEKIKKEADSEFYVVTGMRLDSFMKKKGS